LAPHCSPPDEPEETTPERDSSSGGEGGRGGDDLRLTRRPPLPSRLKSSSNLHNPLFSLYPCIQPNDTPQFPKVGCHLLAAAGPRELAGFVAVPPDDADRSLARLTRPPLSLPPDAPLSHYSSPPPLHSFFLPTSHEDPAPRGEGPHPFTQDGQA
jgi:hypothetical protein